MVIFADDAAPLRRRVRKPTRVPYDQISWPEEMDPRTRARLLRVRVRAHISLPAPFVFVG